MLAKTEIPTAAEVRSIIAKILTIAFDGSEQHWLNLLGVVAALTRPPNSHSNWIVRPRGTAEERDLINRAAAVVKEVFPYVAR